MDATAWAKAVADLVKKQIAGAIEPITNTLDKLRSDIEALPKPERGEKGERGERGERGEKGEPGERGEKGERGQDVDSGQLKGIEQRLDELQLEVSRVDKSVKGLPPPEPGPPGKTAFEIAVSLGYEGTVEDWLRSLQGAQGERGEAPITPEQVADLVKAAVAAIPKPADGKDGRAGRDVDFDQVREFLAAEVAKFPRPADGKTPAVEELRALVLEAVKDLPQSVTLEQVKEAVHTAFDELEVPNFDDALAEARQAHADARALIAQTIETIEALPKPPQILEAARAAAAELPRPKDGVDGKDADPEAVKADVLKIALAAIDERFAALPKPTNGLDGKSVTVDEVKAALLPDLQAALVPELQRALPTPEHVGAQIRAAIEALPKPKDGEAGRNGADVDMDVVRQLISTEVAGIKMPIEEAARLVDERIHALAGGAALKDAAAAHFGVMVESLIERLESHDA